MLTLKTPGLFKILLLVLLPLRLWGQIADDFSDGDFTANPAWTGETAEFVVNAAGELQLNAPDAGTSALSVAGNIADSSIWQLDLRLEFAPSTSNLLRIYLLADQADLLQANGYYLEIGENGTTDALRFFRQDGAAKTLLATGISGFVANDPVDIRLRVKRSVAGDWTLDAAPKSGAFQPQFVIGDATYGGGPGRFFGVYCVYTATRKDKFFFDNLSILPDVPDQKPPVLLGAQALDAHTVSALFDEALDSASALNPAHYSIAGLAVPTGAAFAGSSRQEVRLSLNQALPTGTYTLQTNLVADTLGNASALQSAEFQYLSIGVAAEFDILINEIMADPSPSVGLPDVEWLELYNRSDKVIDLQTLRLSDGGTPQVLPAKLLYPDSFIVLSTAAGAASLAAFTPRVLTVTGFPSLNNDGDPLSLTDAAGTLIDQVVYSINWHGGSGKGDGGWTLERINPNLPCLGRENWQSCPVLPGGTPGAPNASLQTLPDTAIPHLLAVFPEDATTLRVVFSEGMDKNTVPDPAAYQLAPPRAIAAASLVPGARQVVLITLAEPLQSGILYAFTAKAVVRDCSGNSIASTDTVFVGLPEVPAPQDIVINEILFNPATGGVDFVELYNRSNKIFNWQHFFLANFSDGSDIEPVDLDRLLLPGGYAVFTPNILDIQNRFSQVNPAALYNRTLPSLPDDAGNITLFYSDGGAAVTVDSFDYQAGYHNALLSSADRSGVSLERIRPEGETNDPANWTSAARSISGGNGTPTRLNGQHLSPGIPSGDLLTLDPARLSPDGDGYEDFLNIRYQLPAAGYSATLTIFDSEGIPVRRLLRQDLIGTEGALRWDGDADDGTRARPGIYILFMEVFTPEGTVQRSKKPFAVVQRM